MGLWNQPIFKKVCAQVKPLVHKLQTSDDKTIKNNLLCSAQSILDNDKNIKNLIGPL